MVIQPHNAIYLHDKSLNNYLVEKLQKLPKYTDRDFYSDSVRRHIVNKLELDAKYWQKFLEEIFLKIRKNGFVIIKNLPFDENDKLCIGISSIIGVPIEPYQSEDTHMVRKQKVGNAVYDQDIYPHTDGAHWPEPNDFTALQCVSPDQKGGGFSRIVLIDDVLNYLSKNSKDHIINNFTKIKFPFLLHKNFGNAGFHHQLILTQVDQNLDSSHVRFAARYIEECIKKYNLKLNQKLLEEVVEFERVINKIGIKTQFLLDEGDWLIFDNKRIIHSRTSISLDSKRIIKKIKINIKKKKCMRIKLS